MKSFNLCLLGFGNVGRALVRLLEEKRDELREDHGIEFLISGIASRKTGWIADSQGIDSGILIDRSGLDTLPRAPFEQSGVRDWLRAAQADVMFETTSLNPLSGQPAIEYIRAALEIGVDAITANKGPVAHAYMELSETARVHGRRFLFESAAMDCLPVFSLFRETLPAAHIIGFSGIFNSTSTVIIEAMESGDSFEEGVRRAQALGIAETDPSHDVDGWDAALKVCEIANVLMGAALKPAGIERRGIRQLDPARVRIARAEGRPFRLVSRARLESDGKISAKVGPEQVEPGDYMAQASSESLMIAFELDVLAGLTLVAHNPNLKSTAYGMLADFITAARGKAR
jgi:homoserine dehydrogenase